jgi:hypothetical protein
METEVMDTTKKKRKKTLSPTARSLAECRKRGWTAGVVEKFVRFPPPGHLVDLFGVIDIIAITPNGILGIQATSGSHHSDRRTKILAEPRAKEWTSGPYRGLFELWTWSKKGDRGKRKTWQLRVETYDQILEGSVEKDDWA